MSNILPRREDSSKTGNLKIDDDSESDNSNDALACDLLEGAKLIDIMKKTIELEKKDIMIQSTYKRLTQM